MKKCQGDFSVSQNIAAQAASATGRNRAGPQRGQFTLNTALNTVVVRRHSIAMAAMAGSNCQATMTELGAGKARNRDGLPIAEHRTAPNIVAFTSSMVTWIVIMGRSSGWSAPSRRSAVSNMIGRALHVTNAPSMFHFTRENNSQVSAAGIDLMLCPSRSQSLTMSIPRQGQRGGGKRRHWQCQKPRHKYQRRRLQRTQEQAQAACQTA